MNTTKDQLEGALGKGSVKPAYRTRVGNEEVFVADGFVTTDKLRYLHRFGVKATAAEFPLGAFATIWFVPRRAGWGGCCVFDANHDPAYSATDKFKMRIRQATEKAREKLKEYSGLTLH